MFSLKDVYNFLPPPIQSVAASIHGYQLWRKRYYRDTEKLVQEALERESWSTAQWKTWRDNRLEFILHRAATKVPYYRELWQNRRQNGDKSSWSYLENWPVLEKSEVRKCSTAFVADDVNINNMLTWRTSGTTGTPIIIYKSTDTERQWYALAEARWRNWYQVSRFDSWAIFGGQVVVPFERTKPPFWVWNTGMKQLYMSSYHLASRFAESYIEAVKKYRVRYLYGYSSALNSLAQEVIRLKLSVPKLEVVITNAEPLFEFQRKNIETAFNCPVRETYGMTEMIMAASECQAGHLHMWPEVGIPEFLQNDMQVVPAVGEGELIGTCLINADMCLIRYRIGDQLVITPEQEVCACGRNLPIISKVQGRTEDVLYTPDGRRTNCFGLVLWGLPIKEWQLIQESLDFLRVVVVPTTDYSAKDDEAIIARVREVMGNEVEVKVEKMAEMPRGSNGKARTIICKINPGPTTPKSSL